MGNATLVTLKGIIKSKLPDKSGTSKAGKAYVRRTFILTPLDGSKDLFVSTFNSFDQNLIGQPVKVDAEQFNETSYNAKGEVIALEDGVVNVDVVDQSPVNTTPTAKPRAVSSGSRAVRSDGVDWAAKDRAMAAGGIMHDAAALVAPTIAKTAKVDDIIAKVQEVATKLVAVKRAVEEELKS